MIIKTSFNVLEEAMGTVTSIVSDKMLQEDFKNLVVWVKEGDVRFCAYNGDIISATAVEAQVEGEVTEEFVQLRAKDINDVIASFKGLTRTKVGNVEFHISENEAILNVHEEPVDDEIPNADEYRQVSKFRITKPRVKEIIKKELALVNMNFEGHVMDSGQVLVYLLPLYTTVAKETRESSRDVLFSNDHIYTVLTTYSAIMDNRLEQNELFSGFRLKNTTVNFLKNFIQNEETFLFHKEEKENGMVLLSVKVNNSVSVIKCANMSRAYDISNFVTTPENGVVLDRSYFLDVLRRLSLSNDATVVEVDIEDGVGNVKVLSKNMKQSIPVIQAKGSGSYSFTIRADILSQLTFSNVNGLGENVFLYLENNDRGGVVLAVKDNTGIWQTKMSGLTKANSGSFAWS